MRNDVSDAATRALEAEISLATIRQEPTESWQAYLERYEAISSELPYTLTPLQQSVLLLVHARQDIRERVIGKGIPENRKQLNNEARRAESVLTTTALSNTLMGTTTPSTSQRRQQPRCYSGEIPQRSNCKLTSGGLFADQPSFPDIAPRELTPRPAVKCYNCQQTGHYADRCPEANCLHCHEKGHSARRCPQAGQTVSFSNATPVVRRITDDDE